MTLTQLVDDIACIAYPGGKEMQFMLLIYLDEKSLTEGQRAQCYGDSAAYAQQLHQRGQCVAVSPLQPTSTAQSVRFRDGKAMVTDGPFAETREQLGGFFLINARDRDEAVKIAQQIPAGRWGTVEVRPLLEIGGLPQT